MIFCQRDCKSHKISPIHLRNISALTLILASGLAFVSLMLTRIVSVRSHYPQIVDPSRSRPDQDLIGIRSRKMLVVCIECTAKRFLHYSHPISLMETTFSLCCHCRRRSSRPCWRVPLYQKFCFQTGLESEKSQSAVVFSALPPCFLPFFFYFFGECASRWLVSWRFQMAIGTVFFWPGGLAGIMCTVIENLLWILIAMIFSLWQTRKSSLWLCMNLW